MLSGSRAKSAKPSVWYFYWTRPIGAPESHFRLAVTTAPLWGCRHLRVDSLCTEISMCQPCKKLEMIVTCDASSWQRHTIAEDEWKSICQTLSIHHGPTLTSLKFVGLSQKQMIMSLECFRMNNDCKIKTLDIELSTNFPNDTLRYLWRHFSSLEELLLLDSTKCVLLYKFDDLIDLIMNLSQLRLLVVEPRFVLARSGINAPDQKLGLLFDAVGQSLTLEHVIFSFACLTKREPILKHPPRTLADLLKEPKDRRVRPSMAHKQESTCQPDPPTPICPNFLQVNKAKLQFALSCNAFRREFIEHKKPCCMHDETILVIEAGLRALKEWMDQHEHN